MSDSRGRIVGTFSCKAESAGTPLIIYVRKFSHHYHLMHMSINNAVFFSLVQSLSTKRNNNHSIPAHHSLQKLIHTSFSGKLLNLTSQIMKKCLHFSSPSEICTACKNWISTENLLTWVSE
jgi:hypothetical protein